MKQNDWLEATEVIHSMNKIVRHFNDEDWSELWLFNGVPDDCETIENIREQYPNDEDFDEAFEELQSLFCRLIVRQCARIEMPEDGTDFPPTIKYNTRCVIYCHQKLHKKGK